MKPVDAPSRTQSPPEGARTGSRRATPVEQALVERFREALGAGEQQGETSRDEGATPDSQEITPVAPRRERDESAPYTAADDGSPDTGFDAGEPPVLTVSTLAPAPGTVGAATASVSQAPPAYHAAVVAQLLEKHVRQLLVSESGGVHSDQPSVMLNLTDAVLPGTQITLTQTQSGWKLASQSTSTSSYRVVNEMAPQLKERFAERGLGELELDISVHETR